LQYKELTCTEVQEFGPLNFTVSFLYSGYRVSFQEGTVPKMWYWPSTPFLELRLRMG